ncbi:hypothetical protein [Streptomyces sp. NPDC013457]|uniref:hypothetical protein n=1 Tax=Streptomyces sp. NPDC013457 TaxID=3364866 RepID=UPI0036F985AD
MAIVDWRDQAAAEEAWDTYLDGTGGYRDPWGIYSAAHLMKRQRQSALAALRGQGYDIPLTPDPSADWAAHASISDWGGEWLPSEVRAALEHVPEDVARRAWQHGFAEALDWASFTHLSWSTDTF